MLRDETWSELQAEVDKLRADVKTAHRRGVQEGVRSAGRAIRVRSARQKRLDEQGRPVAKPIAQDEAVKKNSDVLSPIYPNAGVEAAYRKRLLRLVNEMARSYRWFVTAAYRKDTPVLAEDADPADELKRAMEKLADRWRRRFDDAADDLATYFAKSSGERTDASLRAALKRAGFTIEFRPSPAQRDVMAATVQANVSLIKSIPQQYLTQVEGSVFRAVQTGGDLGTLTKELQKHAGVTRRRAAFIARDQGNKACAAMKRARQTELGIEEEEWRHSGGGKTKRPSHVKAGKDRVRYKVSEGWLDPATGRRIWPGTEVGCRCVGRPVIKGLEGWT